MIPPQPMVSQTRTVLAWYEANGGSVQETVLPGGHGCHLESMPDFLKSIANFFEKQVK